MAENLEELVDAFIASIPEQVEREEIKLAVKGDDKIVLPQELLDENAKDSGAPLYKIIADLSIPQKIKLALFGNLTARNLLIRDTNRQIPFFVLQNARVTENEIQEWARNTNLSDQILRQIASNPEWMKSYNIKVSIVSNPKVPIDASLKWVKFLQTADLRRLAKSKNIPQVIANQCRKMLDDK